MTHFECSSASAFTLSEIAGAVTRSFDGYFIPVEMTEARLLSHIRLDSVGLSDSLIALADAQIAGAALIARRGWSSRVAAMGIASEWRGKGMGRFLLSQVMEQARARGDRSMTLEVIEQNEPATRLYASAGFRKLRRLVSLARDSVDAAAAERPAPLEQMDIRELGRLIAACGLPDLPWQLSAETIGQLGEPFKAFRLHGAFALISDPSLPDVRFYSLLVEPRARGQGSAKGIIDAILARHPGKAWHVPAIFPEEIVGPFEAAGFHRETLSQWQMEVALR